MASRTGRVISKSAVESEDEGGAIEIDCKVHVHVIDRREPVFNDRRQEQINTICVCREVDINAANFKGQQTFIVNSEAEAKAWAS